VKKNVALKLVPAAEPASVVESRAPHACIGRIVTVDANSVPHVDFESNDAGPIAARLALSSADADRLARNWHQMEVLIVFADGDARQPVITGLVRNALDDPLYQIADWEGFRQLLLRAEEELVLECGDARIVLRRDGKLTIVGREILSRAAQRHCIRGATIDIN
jgi:hypothetical protein